MPGPMWPAAAASLRRLASSERIGDDDSFDLAAVGHVFGIEFTASEGAGGGDDGAVPVGKPVRRFDFQCASKDRESDLLDLKPGPCAKKGKGGLVRQRAG